MKSLRRVGLPVLLALLALWLVWPVRLPSARSCVDAGRAPRLRPDYTSLVIPPNIAPLTFSVAEPGTRYAVRLSGQRGRPLVMASRRGAIVPPDRAWRALLAANRESDLRLEVFVRAGDGRWTRFAPVTNHVSADPVDGYVVYRRFRPFYNSTGALTIRQRNLTSFDERTIMTRDEVGGGCMNCHTFQNRRPDSFLIHSRPREGSPAMTLVSGSRARTVDTRAGGSGPPAGYATWHPNGRLVAFSRNKILQYFPQAGPRSKAALDVTSSLAVYDVCDDKTTVPTALNPPGRLPTFPCWSPDGDWLYFASAPALWDKARFMPIDEQKRLRYDIQRAAYDPAGNSFGPPRTVVSASTVNGSALEPRVSPDGRYLVFTVCDSGSFPVFAERADLWQLDLTRPGARPEPMEPGGATRHDSFHSWSDNSRWLICASKRDNGLLARLYLRHVAADGTVSRPFVLPQADPTADDRDPTTYNVPEFVLGPITVSRAELQRSLRATSSRPQPPPASKQEGQAPEG